MSKKVAPPEIKEMLGPHFHRDALVLVQVGDYVIRDVFWPEDMTTMPEDYLRHILGQHKEHLEGK